MLRGSTYAVGLAVVISLIACLTTAPRASACTASDGDCLVQDNRAQLQVRPEVTVQPYEPNTETMVANQSQANGDCSSEPTEDLPFKISVDGKTLGGHSDNDADSQRCTDMALERADIQIRYDGLEEKKRLNVVAAPNAALKRGHVVFATYANYQLWLERGEIRIFRKSDTTRQTPLATVPVVNGVAQWQAPDEPDAEFDYVLRVYDPQGRFDETHPKVLKLADVRGGVMREGDLIAVYGGDALKVHNINVSGGAVMVSGRDIPAESQVNVMGLPVPVDEKGNFAVRQILSSGPHQVDVAIRDANGSVAEFSRSAVIPDNDFFYIALADLTAGRSSTSGLAGLVRTDKQDEYSKKYFVNGRLAFYLKGKIKGDYLITAAADTRDQPFRHLFSNFDSKDPRFLLRNLDPNKHYPVYGDDSTLVDDAPTRGKFYVRVERGDSSVMWGNFKTSINGTDFVRYERGLYGARANMVTDESTQFGERRGQVEAFAAQPGTIGARDVFRGTGGSHYYLRRQNITQGSERLTVEVRDKNTGLVLRTKTLSVTEDYEINYIQGRLSLRQPLSSVADDDFIVQVSSLSGHEQYLIVTYEYTPGLEKADDRVVGGRASYWVNDLFRVGTTAYDQRQPGEIQRLFGVDATLRYKPGTYIKVEVARSDGPGSGEAVSLDGGFTFSKRRSNGRQAWAKRVEAAIDLAEITPDRNGRLWAYVQQKDRGFSGPGHLALDRATREMGAQADIRISQSATFRAKVDEKSDEYRRARAGEVNVDYDFDDYWMLTLGARTDDNDVRRLSNSATLNRDGSRTDMAARITYDSHDDWLAYAFGQVTAAKTGTRKNNNRVGVGGEFRITDKLTSLAEISVGNGGLGGKLGTEYQIDEHKTVYQNYTLDTDRTDILSTGGEGLLTTGARVRFSDSFSVFGEERWRHRDDFSGLTHAYGLEFVPYDHWSAAVALEFGELHDEVVGDVDRIAGSTTLGYAHDGLTYTGKLEYRADDTVTSDRDTYLLRNSVGVRINPDWRFIGQANGSYSNSTLGDFYDGNFAEGVAGFAYRPIDNDKLNMLFKYSFLYELPSPGQIAASGIIADYSQRSHVLSIDTIYDLNQWITLGGKYAYRSGQLRDNRVEGDWFDSEMHLAIGRIDLHVVKEWDVVAEARWLESPTADDSRVGALVGVYRHINDNLKLGVGYNFTDFSDDLTDLDYDHKGIFVNAIAKY